MDVEGAIEYFLLGGIYSQLAPVDVAMVGTVGQAIPPAWQDFLIALSNSNHMREFDWLTPAELENVVLVNQDMPTSVLGFIVNGLSTRRGIVFGTHVFLREGVFNYIMENEPPSFDDLCGQDTSDPEFSIVQLLVHELTHVKQYLELTPNGFYANYIYHEAASAANPLEDEAIELELTVMDRLAECTESQGAELVSGAHALSAWQWLHVNDRARLRSMAHEACAGDLNVAYDCFAPVSGGGWLGVGGDAMVGNVLSAGPIQLRSRCNVDGDVTSASYVELQQDARVEGSTYPHAPICYSSCIRLSKHVPF